MVSTAARSCVWRKTPWIHISLAIEPPDAHQTHDLGLHTPTHRVCQAKSRRYAAPAERTHGLGVDKPQLPSALREGTHRDRQSS